jgi:DNA-binding NtrC family response regulator
MKQPTILVIGREISICEELVRALRLKGCSVLKPDDEMRALVCLRKQSPDLILAASRPSAPFSGCHFARQVREHDSSIPIILLVQESSEASAIAALKLGVCDYFRPPFSADEIVASVEGCLTSSSIASALPAPGSIRPNGHYGQDFAELIGESPTMEMVKQYVCQAAPSHSTVLITGETGTGKELVAKLIHQRSGRGNKPFVCINCAALPDTLLESELFGYERGAFTGATSTSRGKMDQAQAGTIFFDEIGDMSLHAQTAILRAIETKQIERLGGRGSIPVDVRIIAATNADLEILVSEQKFRKDLFYRLNVARIKLKPLRERKEDIPLLLDHYIREFNARFNRAFEGFSDGDLALLLAHHWPGNVRELKNFVEASFISAPVESFARARLHLPEALRSALTAGESLPTDERERLLSALLSTNWNVSKAAHQLHWSRMTLYRKMAKYHFTRSHYS